MVSSLGQLGMSSGDSPQNIYTILYFFEPSDWLIGWLGKLGQAKESRSGARQAKAAVVDLWSATILRIASLLAGWAG